MSNNYLIEIQEEYLDEVLAWMASKGLVPDRIGAQPIYAVPIGDRNTKKECKRLRGIKSINRDVRIGRVFGYIEEPTQPHTEYIMAINEDKLDTALNAVAQLGINYTRIGINPTYIVELTPEMYEQCKQIPGVCDLIVNSCIASMPVIHHI